MIKQEVRKRQNYFNIVFRTIISAKTIPYTFYMWFEVSKNGTKLLWNEIVVVRSLQLPSQQTYNKHFLIKVGDKYV